MSATIRAVPETVRTDPEIAGLEVSETEWRLDVERYQEFVAAATGISPAEGLSASDCYRIGNRLQALVEEHKQQAGGESALVGAYPTVESLEEFLWVARVFRACHDTENCIVDAGRGNPRASAD
jgi:hypothetical protein